MGGVGSPDHVMSNVSLPLVSKLPRQARRQSRLELASQPFTPTQIHRDLSKMPGPASRASVLRLLNLTSNAGCRSCGKTHSVASTARHHAHPHVHSPSALGTGMRGLATPVDLPVGGPPPGNSDYAFEVS
jgi:hypothetical protein